MGKKIVRMHELSAERQKNSRVIALMNNKGGCGKTTTAMALGLYMARTGNNVLFWDNDPQSNLTQRLALSDDKQMKDRLNRLFNRPEEKTTSIDIVEYPYLQRIPKTSKSVGKIALMPGSHMAEISADALARNFTLGNPYKDEIGYKSIYQFFKKHVDSYRKYYDYIIIDTAPALEGNILNRLAVKAAQEIIYPVDGLEGGLGVRQILNWMDGQTIDLNPRPNALFAMVKYQMDTKNIGGNKDMEKYHRNAVYRAFKESFGDFVCDNGVKEKRKLRAAMAGFGGHTEYTDLCQEIMTHIYDPDRGNLFEYIAENGAIPALEEKLALIDAKVRKRAPMFKKPKYIKTPVDPNAKLPEI